MTHDSEPIHLMVFRHLITQLHTYTLFITQFPSNLSVYTIYVYTDLYIYIYIWKINNTSLEYLESSVFILLMIHFVIDSLKS